MIRDTVSSRIEATSTEGAAEVLSVSLLQHPDIVIAVLCGACVVAFVGSRDFGPRVTAAWATPATWYIPAIVGYLSVLLVLYLGVTLLLLLTAVNMGWVTVPAHSAMPGADSALPVTSGWIASVIMLGPLCTVAAFHLPVLGAVMRRIRNIFRQLGGIPGYVAVVSGTLCKADYTPPPTYLHIKRRVERLGSPMGVKDDGLRKQWIDLSSVIKAVVDTVELLPRTTRSEALRKEARFIREQYDLLAVRARHYFALAAKRAKAANEASGVFDPRNPGGVIELQRRVDEKSLILVQGQLLADANQLYTKACTCCARLSAIGFRTRPGRLRFLRSLGFDVKAHPGLSANRLLLLLVSLAALFFLMFSYLPPVLALWGHGIEFDSSLTRNVGRSMMIASMYIAAAWAAIVPRRVYYMEKGAFSPMVLRDNVRAMVLSLVVAAVCWLAIGVAYGFIKIVAAHGIFVNSSQVWRVISDHFGRWPWVIVVLSVAFVTGMLCWAPSKIGVGNANAFLRRLRDGLLTSLTAIGATFLAVALLRDIGQQPSSVAPVLAGVAGLLIGGVVPEWQRLIESDRAPF